MLKCFGATSNLTWKSFWGWKGRGSVRKFVVIPFVSIFRAYQFNLVNQFNVKQYAVHTNIAELLALKIQANTLLWQPRPLMFLGNFLRLPVVLNRFCCLPEILFVELLVILVVHLRKDWKMKLLGLLHHEDSLKRHPMYYHPSLFLHI